jgi:hypothetical protein
MISNIRDKFNVLLIVSNKMTNVDAKAYFFKLRVVYLHCTHKKRSAVIELTKT